MILFVTGTDTGVGKTYFTCAAVEFLRRNQKNVFGFKPVETGCSHRCRDAYLIGKSSGLEVPPVYCFKTPVAPAVASEIEGVSISKEKLIREISE
ncbi:MAG: dethiobiotin synthase, partial [Desulfurobacteriaceae bacterium]